MKYMSKTAKKTDEADIKNGQQDAQDARGGGFGDEKGYVGGTQVRMVVMGVPRPQPRPRFAKGRVVSTIEPKIQAWQAAVRHAALMAKQALHSGEGIIRSNVADVLGRKKPLALEATFFFGTRHEGRWGLPHVQLPDIDNLLKLVMDQMVKVQLIPGDDCVISCVNARKVWCNLAGSGAIISLREVSEPALSAAGVREAADIERAAWL